MRMTLAAAILLAVAVTPRAAESPVTRADYDRAMALRAKYEALAVDIAGPAAWIGKSERFWYRKAVTGGHQFDLLYIPGAGHGAGGAYGERKRFDFLVRHLLGSEPPTWNSQGLSRTDSPADLFDPADPDDEPSTSE